MIPLPVLGAILAGFILLVGPGDWILLGKLRRRRWTWITFPAVAIGCAFLTVRTAEHYLGIGNQRVSLVITDYSSQGKALRENRFDLWFVGRSQDVVVEKRQALVVPFKGQSDIRPRGRNPVPVYEGRVPGHYTMRQTLTQWTPYLQRTLSFTPDPAFAPLHWEHVDIDAILRSNRQPKSEIAAKLAAPGWSGHIYGPHGDYPFGPVASRAETMMQELSMKKSTGWASSFAPSGRGDLLDLVLDKAPEDYLVVALRQVDRELRVQRCIYHPSDAKP